MGDRPIEGSSSSSSLGLAHQRATHGQHLLFTARHGAGELVLALAQAREDGEDLLHILQRCRVCRCAM
jgi:hypothetical protein